MYVEAVRRGKYTSYLRRGTFLDMMYMTDAIEAIVRLMETDAVRLKHRNAFNVTAMSVDPEMMAAAIRKHVPHFELGYSVDPVRQAIADQWPDRIDVTAARTEWDFQAEYDLDRMTGEMLLKLREVNEGDSKIS
jgi:nucleoside-diphosphate-sugar epimerase